MAYTRCSVPVPFPLALLLLAAAPAAQAQLEVDAAAPGPRPILFGESARILPRGFSQAQGALLDWNRDGRPDLLGGSFVTAPFETTVPTLLRNDGNGNFVDPIPLTTFPFYDPRQTFADLDGDNLLEGFFQTVLFDPPEGGPGSTRLIDLRVGTLAADGSITELWASDLLPELFFDPLVGDLDGDGRLDFLLPLGGGFPSSAIDSVRLFRNLGGGVFEEAALPVIDGLSGVTSARLADLDSDGDLDLFFAGDVLQVLVNDGSASFAAPLTLVVPGVPTVSFFVGDLDQDGDADVLLFSGATELYLQEAGPSLVPAPVPAIGFTGQGPDARPAVADLDGNGTLDIHFGTVAWKNDGAAGFSVAPGAALPSLRARSAAPLHLADLDGDGDVDLWAPGADRVALQDEEGAFRPGVQPTPGEALEGFPFGQFADFSGDGRPDALYLPNNGSWQLAFGDSLGRFVPVPGALPDAARMRPIVPADLDGDGDLDLLFGRTGQSVFNNGSGRFSGLRDPSPLLDEEHVETALVEDFDGDGHVDVFQGTYRTGFSFLDASPDRLWFGDGAGGFTLGALPAIETIAHQLLAEDVDRDGDLDVLVSSGELYRNDGQGGFDAVVIAPVSSQGFRPSSVAVGDVDGDGHLDVYFGRQFAEWLVRGRGQGFFELPEAQPFRGSVRVGLSDLDGDGDADLVRSVLDMGAAIVYELGVFVYESTPNGFSRVNSPRIRGFGDLDVELVDIDLDGDDDIVGSAGTLLSERSSLRWRTLPRLGRPLTFELKGEPNARYFLLASDAFRAGPVGPGLPQLDLTRIVARVSGQLDPEGRSSIELQLPSDPALEGFTAFWQARVRGAETRWSNVETTEFATY